VCVCVCVCVRARVWCVSPLFPIYKNHHHPLRSSIKTCVWISRERDAPPGQPTIRIETGAAKGPFRGRKKNENTCEHMTSELKKHWHSAVYLLCYLSRMSMLRIPRLLFSTFRVQLLPSNTNRLILLHLHSQDTWPKSIASEKAKAGPPGHLFPKADAKARGAPHSRSPYRA
jgi:hypothetical protein